MFTANSMNCLLEAIGLALPGNGTVLATHAERERLMRRAGSLIVELTRRVYEADDASVLPRSIATLAAFENAMALDIAMGGLDQYGVAPAGRRSRSGCRLHDARHRSAVPQDSESLQGGAIEARRSSGGRTSGGRRDGVSRGARARRSHPRRGRDRSFEVPVRSARSLGCPSGQGFVPFACTLAVSRGPS
jgi:hypothetical protein